VESNLGASPSPEQEIELKKLQVKCGCKEGLSLVVETLFRIPESRLVKFWSELLAYFSNKFNVGFSECGLVLLMIPNYTKAFGCGKLNSIISLSRRVLRDMGCRKYQIIYINTNT